MCPSLASEYMDRFNLNLVFKNAVVMGRYPVNMNILASKIWVLQMGPLSKMTSFSKTVATVLIRFLQFMETISLNKVHCWCLQGHNGARIRDLK
jgi:hypothetical protein